MSIASRRRFAIVAAAALSLATSAVWGQQESTTESVGERIRGYVPPPTALRLVDGHWTPYSPPVPPEGADVHVIERGDTLWDLAAHYYGDPYLWPVIWDANRYVTYSHWIYPGDPLVVPPPPTVVGEEGVAEAQRPEPPPRIVEAPTPPPVPEPAPEPEPVPAGPVLIPAAEQQELVCSPQLMDIYDPSPLTVSGREEPEKELQSSGDVVYLSAGLDMGIEPGSEYVVMREVGVVSHPDDGRPLAHYVRRLGRLRVIAVQSHSATAEILTSCDGIRVGDDLAPYRELPVPMVERIPLVELASPTPGRLNGTVVVAGSLESTLAGAGDLIGIDLGTRAGVTAGDRIVFWRDAEGTSVRRVLAQGVVLVTHAGGSVVKVLESKTEIALGDRAEVL